MIVRNTLAAAVTAVALLTTAGCAVTRDQSTVGEYVDDTTISTKVKAKFIEDKAVAASSIQVETMNGTVQLSGFAKSESERAHAAALAREVKGVKNVKNDILVRP
ncbi:BON domain-containing protein [Rhizobacter sp. LjRoot28]|jgi:osmotically-inducible protein OsmY|uniref:BON domain-containing protein n=1 Tax=Rhizobacter sp. LjRoot28 TaxID=3342309 RepID=UPI003ECC33E3